MPDQLSNQFSLTIDAAPAFQFIIQVIVFHADNTILLTGNQFPLQAHFKKGLYTIRIKGNGAISDKIIALNCDQQYYIGDKKNEAGYRMLQPPELKSPVPLDETVYSSSYDYYRKAAINSSALSFPGYWARGNDPTLFIFLRFASQERFLSLNYADETKSLIDLFASRFHLINSHGEKLFVFNIANINREEGWMTFNVSLQSGLYFIMYEGEDPRQVPIYLFPGWHSQVFMVLDKEPLFRTLRMFIQRNRAFDPYDAANKYTDLLLSRLQNNNFTLEENLAEKIFSISENAPMLCLLSAFFLVMDKNRRDESINERIGELVNRLKRLKIEGVDRIPDLDAFNSMHSLCKRNLTGLEESVKPLKGIPVLRIGYEAIKKSAVENPDLIKQRSLNDIVTEHLLSDSAFTTFSPVPVKNELISVVRLKIWDYEGPAAAVQNVLKVHSVWGPEIEEIVASLFTEYAFHIFMESKRGSYFNWLCLQIKDILLENDKITVAEMAKKLQVSATTLKRKIDQINEAISEKMPSGPVRDVVAQGALERSRDDLIATHRIEQNFLAAMANNANVTV